VRLRDALVGRDDVPGLEWMLSRLEEAAYGLTKIGSAGDQTPGGSSGGLVLNEAAAGLLHEIDRAVAGWVLDLEPSSEPFGRARAGCLYLSYKLGELLNMEHVAAILKTVEAFNARALALINRPPSVYCGPCESLRDSGERCGTELWAEDTDTRWVECRRCGTTVDVEAIRARLLERVADEVQSADNWYSILRWLGRELPRKVYNAALVGVNPRMYLQPDGRRNQRNDAESVPLYAYGDVVAALDSPPPGKPRRGRRTAAACATTSSARAER